MIYLDLFGDVIADPKKELELVIEAKGFAKKVIELAKRYVGNDLNKLAYIIRDSENCYGRIALDCEKNDLMYSFHLFTGIGATIYDYFGYGLNKAEPEKVNEMRSVMNYLMNSYENEFLQARNDCDLIWNYRFNCYILRNRKYARLFAYDRALAVELIKLAKEIYAI